MSQTSLSTESQHSDQSSSLQDLVPFQEANLRPTSSNCSNELTSQVPQFPQQLLDLADATARSGGTININFAPQIQDNRQYDFTQTHVTGSTGVQLAKHIVNLPEQSEKREHANTNTIQSYQQEEISSTNIQHQTENFVEEEAIRKVAQFQNESRETDLELHGIGIDKDEIPIVHPQIYKTSFYEGSSSPKNEDYKPSTKQTAIIRKEEEVKFDKLLEESAHYRFISLIGIPGSGKTTCSKRLAKSNGFMCFHMKFMNMNYEEDEKLTLRELLLDNVFPDLSNKECKSAFEWIKKNQSKCLIIMDGLDQAEWTLRKNPPRRRYDSPQKVSDLVAGLCNKSYLPKARLIFTSRPHSMLSLPKSMRPEVTYLLQDLSLDDTKTLFFALVGESAEKLWEELNNHAPELLGMCQCPLMLMLYIRAALNPSNVVGDISTMTRIFATVLENLRRSDNAYHDDVYEIIKQLARVAYKATCRCTVLITMESLRMEGLDIKTVQDLIITVPGFHGKTCKIFEGDKKLYFCHQTFQEYLTAVFICNEMPFDDFRVFVKDKLFTSTWSMIRKFLFGIIFDIEQSKENLQEKRDFLIENLIVQLKNTKLNALMYDSPRVLGNEGDEYDYYVLISLYCDVRECNNDDVTQAAADCCPRRINLITPISLSDIHALSRVLRKAKHMQKLRFTGCNLDSRGFALLCAAIKEMPGTLDELDVSENKLGSDAVDMMPGIFHKINRYLWLHDSFIKEERWERNANDEEIKTLQKALNRSNNPRLQIEIEGTFQYFCYFPTLFLQYKQEVERDTDLVLFQT